MGTLIAVAVGAGLGARRGPGRVGGAG
jgi:hypothetical protein